MKIKKWIKIFIGISIALAVSAYSVRHFQKIWIERESERTAELLKTTMISSVSFQDTPLVEAWQELRTIAIAANPEFEKIQFSVYLPEETTANDEMVTLKISQKTSVIEAIRSVSKLVYMKYRIDGRDVSLDVCRSSAYPVSFKIISWFCELRHRLFQPKMPNGSDPFADPFF